MTLAQIGRTRFTGPMTVALTAMLLSTWFSGCSRSTDESEPTKLPSEAALESQPDGYGVEVGLQPLPTLDLRTTDTQAREQLEQQRSLAEELVADPSSDDPARAEAFGQLARLYITYELLESADTALGNARYLVPDDFRWAYLQGYVTALRGYPHESTDQLTKALELRPDYLPALLRIGRNELELGRDLAAKDSFEKALELDAETAAAQEGLGRIAAAAGDKEAAAKYLERALERDPQASAVHYALGQVYRDLGEFDRARAHLERSGDVLTRISDPLIQPLAELAANVQFYLVQGAEAIDNGNYEAATAAYRAGLAQDPGSLAAARGLAVSQRWLGDYEGALQALQDVVELPVGETEEPGERAQVLALAGDIALEIGLEDEAIERYLESLQLEGDQLGLLVRAADAMSRRARFAEALELYERVLELEPRSAPMILERRAIALINLGRSEQAKAEFEKAIEHAPDSGRLRLRFAEALDYLGESEAAAAQRRELGRLSGQGKDRARLVFEEGRVELSRGHFELAMDRYREAVELAPEFHEARWQLAQVLGHVGRYDEAVQELESVLAASPRNSDVRRDQIVALVLGGRYGETRMKLQEALREFPRDFGFALTQVRLLASAPDARVRDGSLAVKIARRLELGRRDPDVLQALALALAQDAQFEEGADLLRSLLSEEGSRPSPEETELWTAQLASLEEGIAWVALSPEEILIALKKR